MTAPREAQELFTGSAVSTSFITPVKASERSSGDTTSDSKRAFPPQVTQAIYGPNAFSARKQPILR